MTEKMREQLHMSLSHFLFIASIIVAALILISRIHQPLLTPGTGLPLEQAGAVSVTEQGIVVIDRQFHRLLIADPQWKLQEIIDLELEHAPLDKAFGAWLQGDRLFVCGTEVFADGIFLRSESISEFDLKGNFLRELYRKNYGPQERRTTPSIFNIHAQRGNLLFTEINGSVESIKSLSPDGTAFSTVIQDVGEPLQCVLWDEKNANSILFSSTGRFYRHDHLTNQVELLGFVNGQNSLLEYYGLPESERELLFGNGIIPRPDRLSRFTDNVSGEEFLLYINNNLNVERYSYMDRSSKEISYLEYSGPLLFRVCAFWTAAAYILLLLLWGLVRMYRTARPRLGTGILLLLLAALMSGYYTHYSYGLLKANHAEFARLQTEQLHLIVTKKYGDLLTDLENQGARGFIYAPANRQRLADLQSFLNGIVGVQNNEDSFYCCLYAVSDDGKALVLTDSTGVLAAGEYGGNPEEWETEGALTEYKLQENEYHYYFKNIYRPDGSRLAFVEFGYVATNLEKKQIVTALNAFFDIFSILIVIFTAFKTFTKTSYDLRIYRQKKFSGLPQAGAYLFNNVLLLWRLAYSLDSVIFIWIIQELCKGQSAARIAAFTSAVPAAYFLGSVLTLPLLPWLSRHFRQRVIVLTAMVLTICSSLIFLLALAHESAGLYLLGKLLCGAFFQGVVNSLINSLPYNLSDEAEIRRLQKNNQGYVIAADVISILVIAYLARRLGFSAAYIMQLGLFIALAAACWFAFDLPDRPSVRKKEPQQQEKPGRQFFLHPRLFLPVLLFAFAMIICSNYNYLFGLYMKSVGASVLIISNVLVITKFIFLALEERKNMLLEKFSQLTRFMLLFVVMSFCFLGFMVSNTAWWALIACVGIALGYHYAATGIFTASIAEKYGYNVKETIFILCLFNALLYSAVPMLLGLIIPHGINLALIASGLTVLVSAGAIKVLRARI